MNDNKNYFNELFGVDVKDKVENKKSGNTTLSYLSWAWAWAEVKKRYPDANYKIHRYGEDNAPYHYDKGLGYMVSTEVTIGDITHEMWLPVMNHSNKAMKDHVYSYKVNKYEWKDRKRIKVGEEDVDVEQATMFDVNTAIMRCLVKNIGMHGLGLHIYAGEDIPRDLNAELDKENEVNENKEALAYINNKMQDLVKEENIGNGSRDVAIAWLELENDEFMTMYKNDPIKLKDIIVARLEEEKE